MRLVYVFVIVLYLFVCFQKTRCQSNPAQRNRKMKSLITFSKDKRPGPTVTMVLQIKKLYRVDICDRNTSSTACNEHIQTVMGQQKCKTSAMIDPMSNQCYGPKMGRWANATLAHSRFTTMGQSCGVRWANEGPMYTCYLGCLFVLEQYCVYQLLELLSDSDSRWKNMLRALLGAVDHCQTKQQSIDTMHESLPRIDVWNVLPVT